MKLKIILTCTAILGGLIAVEVIGLRPALKEITTEPLRLVISQKLPEPQRMPISKPNPDAELIGRLASGMRRVVEKRDRGNWYACGELLNRDEQIDLSVKIAWRVAEEQRSIGATNIDPWGILATAYNESGFDPCALGLHPRKWAYGEGVLQRRKRTRSHTREDIELTVYDPRMKTRFAASGYDLGLCQVLSKYHRGVSLSDMMTVTGGVRICVLEMHRRAERHRTDTPWAYWRGKKTDWYEQKIGRWVRIMKGGK